MKSLIVTFMLALFLAVFSVSAQDDPLEIIQKKDAELQKLLRLDKKDSSDANTEKIKELINSIFDFRILGRKALKSKVWEGQDSVSREEFIRYFRNMIENSSVKKLEVYEADSTLYETPKIREKSDGKSTKVVAWVYAKGKKSQLVYKMKTVDGRWVAWDLIIDDLSTVRNYREQFNKILEKESFAELIARLKKKAEE